MFPLEHYAILSTFIKLPFVIKIFDLSIFEWPFYTGFTVCGKFSYAIEEVTNISVDQKAWMRMLVCIYIFFVHM